MRLSMDFKFHIVNLFDVDMPLGLPSPMGLSQCFSCKNQLIYINNQWQHYKES
jgi:hypothetical protein